MKKVLGITLVTTLFTMLCLFLGFALAAGTETTESEVPSVEDNYESAVELIKTKDYEGGLEMLLAIVEEDAENADIHSLIGFSSRKSGDLEQAYKYYASALELEPLHVGANEYLGELHVQVGDMDKANEQLEILAGICETSQAKENPPKVRHSGYSYGKTDNKEWGILGCVEHDTLTEIIAEAEAEIKAAAEKTE